MTDRESLQLHKDDADMELSTCSSSDEESVCSMDESCCEDSFDGEMLSTNNDGNQIAERVAPKATPPTSASVLRELIKLLHSDDGDFTAMELAVPIQDSQDFAMIIQGIRLNKTITECSVSTNCFQSLSAGQRRELVFAIWELPSLKSLILDSVFPEFLYTCNYCRCWKRDQYYRQHHRYCEFENRSIEELQVTAIPADVSPRLLLHLIAMTVSNFASLQHLDMIFDGEFASPQAVLTRAALTALSCSRSLKDVKMGYEDDFGDYNFVMELDASRNENILRVLKLRCGEENLSEHSYMELSQMIRMNSRTLKGLVLDTAVDNNGALTIANTLGQSSNLKALCLGTFDCQDSSKRYGLLSLLSQVLCPTASSAADGTRSRSSLEYLSIVCQEMDDQGVVQISKAFAQSQLKELMLFLDNETDSTLTCKGIAALAQALRTNTTIEELSLICHTLNDDGVISFAEALKANSGTLKKLKLQCSKAFCVTPIAYKAVIDMLKTNATLESFQVCRCPGSEEDNEFVERVGSEAAHLEHTPEIDFYLGLNKAGIRSLQLNVNSSPKQFRSTIACHRYDLSKVFYMLSANPSFVAFGL